MAKSKLEILVTAKTDKAVKTLGKVSKATKDLDKKSRIGAKGMSLLDGVMLSLGGMATNFALNLAKSVP